MTLLIESNVFLFLSVVQVVLFFFSVYLHEQRSEYIVWLTILSLVLMRSSNFVLVSLLKDFFMLYCCVKYINCVSLKAGYQGP